MDTDLQAQIAFYLTGNRLGTHLQPIDSGQLIPALFSGHRDLTRLRYDFPLVLVNDGANDVFVEPMSGLIDDILEKIAHGEGHERIRKHVLRIEQEIRVRLADGAHAAFSALWDESAAQLAKSDKELAASLSLARANLKLDGELVDCDAQTPYTVLLHAWQLTQARRAEKFCVRIDRLRLKLSDIIKSDFATSDAGKSAEQLQSSFGNGPLDHFNFDFMAKILRQSAPRESLTPSRRQRILGLISVLETQKFYARPEHAVTPYTFVFDSCASALNSYCERLPNAVELARALAVAELEIRGEYNEAKHDRLFESFGQNGLDASELALFPDYLVRLEAPKLTGAEHSALSEILAVDLPIKILVQTDDIIEKSSVANGHLAFSLRSKQLAHMTLGLTGVFVVQAPASLLYQLQQQIQRGLDYRGPALFSVFSGTAETTRALPPYLICAAALESRAFPTFCFDPSAGSDWASCFSLAENPQVENDWPVHAFAYEDEKQQLVRTQLPFTLLDFVACDTRYKQHFACVPRSGWSETLASAAETLAAVGRGSLDRVPSLTMIDAQNCVHKVIVDEKLIREARRCRSAWNSLQELGGIDNSHAKRLLASAQETSAALSKAAAVEAPHSELSAEAPTEAHSAAAATPSVEAEPERSPDAAYIETSRCSTCNECVQLNSKMFAYDDNKQAYIADVNAGTYAQLVEAAENCQVSIIHPGKPRNPKEPGLDELMKRAEMFI